MGVGSAETVPSPKSHFQLTILLAFAEVASFGLSGTPRQISAGREKTAFGWAKMVLTAFVILSRHPATEITFNSTANGPTDVKEWPGDACVEFPPSPKFHRYLSVPCDPSLM